MSQTPNPNEPRPTEPVNPSVESTRLDDEHTRQVRENAEGLGAAAGAGLGCLGITLAPWLAVLGAIAAGVVMIVVIKSCNPSAGGTTQPQSAAPAGQVERAGSRG